MSSSSTFSQHGGDNKALNYGTIHVATCSGVGSYHNNGNFLTCSTRSNKIIYILLCWLAYDVCRNVFFGFCTPLLLETRKLGLVKWQVLLRILLCFIMPLTSCYLDGSSFCLVSWWSRCHNSMVWHKILSNKISLEFLSLFTIASLWESQPDFRLLRVVIGYHSEYGLLKFQSSYWKRIGEISRIILCFFCWWEEPLVVALKHSEGIKQSFISITVAYNELNTKA